MSNTGVISMGVRCPIIRQGDNIADIVIENVKKTLEENHMSLEDKDVIGITESIVARAQGNYVTVDDIVESIGEVTGGKGDIVLVEPIMSRNRFSLILRAFARYADSITIVHSGNVDQQGNPVWVPNPFTGVDVDAYYKQICEEEGATYEHVTYEVLYEMQLSWRGTPNRFIVDASCHPTTFATVTLANFMKHPFTHEDGTVSGYNEDWGLLGSNKADEETLKLFPRKDLAQKLVDEIQERLFKETGKMVEVMIYGDGCFHSPEIIGVLGSSINEFADPVTSPAFTKGLSGTPNELKIKAFADGKFKDLKGEELENAIKEEIRNSQKDLKGSMTSQGTTPRRYVDLLASLFDLTTGSGAKGSPITICKHYFNTYAD